MRTKAMCAGLALVCAVAVAQVAARAQARAGAATAAAAAAPRPPWGDPDLQGTYTNTYERSVHRTANPETLTITERFTRISPEQVRWSVTIDDPETWTRPWTFSMPLTAGEAPLPHYECHEGNYGLRNILSAARAEERAR